VFLLAAVLAVDAGGVALMQWVPGDDPWEIFEISYIQIPAFWLILAR
jgi:hypothetical protein